MRKKKKTPTLVDEIRSIRKNWNGINPVTRVQESKSARNPNTKTKITRIILNDK
jgi:hypothetical protein